MIREDCFVDNITALCDIDDLLDDNAKITMNLFELILSEAKVCAWSDHKNFIICQSNEQTPIWAWFADDMDDDAVECSADIIAARILQNSNIQLNACPIQSAKVLKLACQKSGADLEKVFNLYAYVCRNLIEPNYNGEAVIPTENDRDAMTELVMQFVEDGEHQIIPKEEAEGFVDYMINARQDSLWKVDGEICAMAMIAHKTTGAARINSVVTMREKRGNGYAGMLISNICKQLISDGITPMLYADADNPSSNNAYKKIGFEKTGDVTQYKFVRKAV